MKLSGHFYKTFILGVPETQDHRSIKRREAFLMEFADQPEAESLRIRYRIALNLMIWGHYLLLLGLLFPNLNRVHLFEWWMSWNSFVSLPFCFLLSYDQNYARRIIHRRVKLAKRGRPSFAEKLLWLFLPPETCEEAIDDINARFEKLRARHDAGFARRWYWWQIVRSVSPTFDLLIERIIKWGIWAWLGQHFIGKS